MNRLFAIIVFVALTVSCGPYSFTGTNISPDVKTYQVDFFDNVASIIEVGLDQEFTIALQDRINDQTNLNLITANGDLIYEGEIVDFTFTPTTASSNQDADQTRVTMTVNLRFINTLNEDDDYEKRYSFFHDYNADLQFEDVRTEATEVIFERILEQIFNDSLARW